MLSGGRGGAKTSLSDAAVDAHGKGQQHDAAMHVTEKATQAVVATQTICVWTGGRMDLIKIINQYIEVNTKMFPHTSKEHVYIHTHIKNS